ncbi:ABC transporter permease [Paenibacillus albiflavus]|uniref:Transport permease protein n=1 Tax=Paenibacillus albiflavus TaxID=2545760 RepID=A0A4R4EAF9_9BACL|nr:ABC transporter permease [Paenibacillus albiflavus]TCZ76619.1 ABC transporter permease [Paenibacillus albiflavus]
MSEMLWLVRKSLSVIFRNRKNWFFYIGLPIIGVLVSMLLYSNVNTGTLKIGIINQDSNQTITSDAIHFVEGLNQVKITLTDEETMNREIAAGKLDSGIVFKAGFADSVRSGTPSQLDIVSVKGAQVTAYVKAMLQSYIGNVAAIGQSSHGDAAAFDTLYTAYTKHNFKLTSETLQDSSNMKMMTYQSIGFLVMFMMLSAFNMMEGIIREKENRTFLRLLSSPMSSRAYVLSNVVVSIIILLIQIVVTLIVMKNVLQIDTGISFVQLVPALLLFSLTAIALALMLIAFAKGSTSAGALQNLVIVPTCLLAGCFFPVDIMPDTVRKISNFTPQHWLLDMINKLQQGETFGSLYLNIAILLAFAVAFALIAIYRFGRNNDVRQFI